MSDDDKEKQKPGNGGLGTEHVLKRGGEEELRRLEEAAKRERERLERERREREK